MTYPGKPTLPARAPKRSRDANMRFDALLRRKELKCFLLLKIVKAR